MSRKNDILTNLREYSSDQIVEAIKDGVVTLYELSKSGNLTPLMRKRIENKLAAGSSAMSSERPKRPQDDVQLADVETPLNKVEVSSNQAVDTGKEKTTIPEVVIPEAVIAPTDQGIAHSTNAVEQEQAVYDEQPSNRGMFKRPFSFHGRIRRLEYGLSVIIYYIWCFLFLKFVDTSDDILQIFLYVTLIIVYWFLFAQNAKRCHDRNHSGWFQLVPFYGLWMLFADGDEGENDYGDNPKGE